MSIANHSTSEKSRAENIAAQIESLESPHRSEEILRYFYLEESKSQREIAARLDCSQKTVSKYLKKYSIETRTNAGVEAAREARRVERAGYYVDAHGYSRWDSWDDGSQTVVKVHQLTAVAQGVDPHEIWNDDTDTVCHHSVGHKLANIPHLIETMSSSEHRSLHANGEWQYDEDTGWPTLQMPDEEEPEEESVTEKVQRGARQAERLLAVLRGEA